ncbi:lamin tail domain-containing protein [Candidatus Falkowbacteria bacterium]|nr:lamin tail domain-containing protein [Candidatus Falkowbacteria bacterium]
MRKIIAFLFLVFVVFIFKTNNSAASGSIVISEFVTRGPAGAYDEFAELYNPTNQAVDLTGWKLQTKSADGISWTNRTGSSGLPGGVIQPKSYYLISAKDYSLTVSPDYRHSANWGLSDTGGHIRIADSSGMEIDKVGYGNAINPEGVAFAGDLSSGGVERKAFAISTSETMAAGGAHEWQGNNYDSDNNANDFILRASPDPQNSASLAEPEESAPGDAGATDNSGDTSSNTDNAPENNEISTNSNNFYNLGDAVINEFVSDPGDTDVEWIELYNTTAKEIDLSGWTVEEGSGAKTNLSGKMGISGTEKFKIIEKPKGNLNNGGDIIILRDGAGNLIDQVAYGNWNDGNAANNAPAASDPASVARKFDGQNTYNNVNDFAATAKPTKGESNIIESEESEEGDDYDYSSDIVISEIFPNPEGDDADGEFIEFYNKGSRDIDLSGWKLGDNSKTKHEIAASIIKAGGYLVIYRKESKIALNNTNDSVKLYQPLKDEPLQTVKYEKAVEKWSYNNENLGNANAVNNKWVWSETVTPGKENIIKTINHPPVVDFNVQEEIIAGVPVIFDSSDTSDEDGDKLAYEWDFSDGVKNNLARPEHTFLKDGAYKVKLTVSDRKNEVAKEKVILVLRTDLTPYKIPPTPSRLGGTKGADIVINEILPNPEGDDNPSAGSGQGEGEWIELYNAGKEKVSLLNWKMDDGEGGSSPYEFMDNLLLPAAGFYVLERPESGLTLNNSGDSARLYNNLDEMMDEVEYENAAERKSYARSRDGKWFWTSELTPGEENVISAAGDGESKKTTKTKKVKGIKIASVALEKIKDYDVGDFIKTAGTVAVKPGVLGTQIFYIVGSPGIQIYNYKKEFPVLEVGDYIEVAGELSSVNGEMRLKTGTAEDIKVVEHRQPPAALELACDKVNEDYIGQLVKISGEITERKSSTVYLDDGTDEAIVYVKKGTDISPNELKEGEKAVITGIVGKTKMGVRIMPRSIEDIIFQGANAAQLPGEVSANDEWALVGRDKKMELFKYLLVIAGGAIIVLAVMLVKLTKKAISDKK